MCDTPPDMYMKMTRLARGAWCGDLGDTGLISPRDSAASTCCTIPGSRIEPAASDRMRFRRVTRLFIVLAISCSGQFHLRVSVDEEERVAAEEQSAEARQRCAALAVPRQAGLLHLIHALAEEFLRHSDLFLRRRTRQGQTVHAVDARFLFGEREPDPHGELVGEVVD